MVAAVMKLAIVQCHGCDRIYEAAIEEELSLPCPGCGQNNMIVKTSVPLNGRCQHDGLPLDDHLYGSGGYCCPPKKG